MRYSTLFFFLATSIANAASINYTLDLANQKDSPIVTICSQGIDSQRWVSELRDASNYIKPLSNNLTIHPHSINVSFSNVDNGCFKFQIDGKSFRQRKSRSRWMSTVDSAIHRYQTGLFNWRPVNEPSKVQHQLTVLRSDDQSLSFPFERLVESNEKVTYHLNHEPSFMSLPFYSGNFLTHDLKILDARVQVAFLSPHSEEHRRKIERWLTTCLSALSKIYGALPFKDLQITVLDVNRPTAEPTPFAMVFRGDGKNISFFINRHAAEKEFVQDWTAYHELSHLVLPFIDRRDAWVSEGFASYYQYIIMGREGILSAPNALKRLRGGIQRGLENHSSTAHLSLDRASQTMRQTRSFRRVYWSGAIAWMEADIELRKNNSSLDQVIKDFNQCCRHEYAIWDSQQLAQRLDDVAPIKVFHSIFSKLESSKEFPAFHSLLRQLGAHFKSSNQVEWHPTSLGTDILSP
ncbi:hypothetical protein [Pleionea sediminis]|uniref:M61 family metallopeptidase n=1 Tax=Pleionea sediminis TaxID=2569479 RepID=UPI00197B8618|nr:hypothetical protein [Pleionea sediminis]